MRNLGLIGLLVVLLTTITLAQGQHRKGKAKLNPEAKAALQELNQKEIYPAKKELHSKFIGQLSAADQSFLEQKRQESKGLEEEAKKIREQMRADKKAGKEVDHKTAMAPLRDKRNSLLASMRPFLEAQKAPLEDVMGTLKEQQKVWKAKKKAILEKYTTAEEQEKMKAARHDNMNSKHKEKAKKDGASEEDKELKRAVRFVLWDGEMKERKEGKHKKGGKGKRGTKQSAE